MQKLSSLKVYIFFIVFIVGWWAIAFSPKAISKLPLESTEEVKSDTFLVKDPLHFADRQSLQQALAGDFPLMGKLIVEWDIDAQFLKQKGFSEVRRLDSDQLLRSQWLYRQLQDCSQQELDQLEESYRLKSIVDDIGVEITLARPFRRFLPQTYSAASFLLALTPSKEIVALPGSLREQTQLYPKSLTDQIALNIERHNGEKLFLAKPEIAFIAHYSHPATIQALAQQGVLLYTMKNPSSLKDISYELIQIGHLVNRPLEAELLNIFMEAAILAIENKFLMQAKISLSANPKSRSVLFLNHHQGFSLPTTKTLTGQLLTKIGGLNTPLKYIGDMKNAQEWRLPVDKEYILNLDPDCLIIATESPETLEKEMRYDYALQQLSAVHHHHLYFVDEAIQESPSQYIVLAYFDLVQALSRLL